MFLRNSSPVSVPRIKIFYYSQETIDACKILDITYRGIAGGGVYVHKNVKLRPQSHFKIALPADVRRRAIRSKSRFNLGIG